ESGDSQLRYWLNLLALGQMDVWTATIGLGTIALVLGITWLNKVLPVRLPDLLLAVIIMAGLVWAASLPVTVIGKPEPIPQGLPAFQVPSITASGGLNVRDLAGSGLAIA